eukprot:2851373-Pyramimonas_sp.AAC.1
MYEDPWAVFWTACRKDSRRHFGGTFDGPPLDLARSKVWQCFQSHVDPSTTLRCNFYIGPSGESKSRFVRTFDRGE